MSVISVVRIRRDPASVCPVVKIVHEIRRGQVSGFQVFIISLDGVNINTGAGEVITHIVQTFFGESNLTIRSSR